ncbi:MAG: sigma-70 family RNA polymerase sigma factor [Calditrichae bacterium]|nr:sigma-70 family RNA polymerase sigma factor [Calditrichota bacterium]MCB9057366.1 sigma-70 family RNA polymerase sigma factor [Calditrichia bacterium]
MNDNDFELIKLTKNGDLTAFDSLMQKYEKLVYKISYGFGRSKENALDISQEVFLKVFQKINKLRDDRLFKSWIIKITYNEGVDWVKKNRHLQTHASIDNETDFLIQAPSNEDEFLAKEHKSELIKSLYNLNTRYRLAVVLRYFEDMPIKEIAQTLQCSEGVVKNMLFRSLRKLKTSLQLQNSQR